MAGRADVLELQICRIRFNVNHVAFGLIGSRLAFRVGAAQGIHVRQCRIVQGILIDHDTGGGSGCGGTGPKGRFQNQPLFLGFWLEEFTIPTIPTLVTDRLIFRGVEVQEIRAFRTKSHCSIGCGVLWYREWNVQFSMCTLKDGI